MVYMSTYNSVIMNTLGIPIINNFEHLAEKLSITEGLLYKMTYQKGYCYKEVIIPKKDGTGRVLNVPIFALKVTQRWILKEILEKINVSNSAMAFIPRKNGLKENAECHRKNIFLLEMDISNFFNSIDEKRVFKLFCNMGYNAKVSTILTNLCTFNKYLPQGAVTSPYLANLICFQLDIRINGLCSKRDIEYSRYADDLSFSSNNRASLNKIEPILIEIIKDEGFQINPRKTRYLSNDVKKTITGITINDESIHVDKKFKHNIRAMIFKSLIVKDYSNNEKIRGMIAFVSSIEEGYKEKIIKYINTTIKNEILCTEMSVVEAYNKNKLFSILDDMIYVANDAEDWNEFLSDFYFQK